LKIQNAVSEAVVADIPEPAAPGLPDMGGMICAYTFEFGKLKMEY